MRALLSFVEHTEELSASQTDRQTVGLDERQTGREIEWTTRKTVRTCSQTDRQTDRQINRQATRRPSGNTPVVPTSAAK